MENESIFSLNPNPYSFLRKLWIGSFGSGDCRVVVDGFCLRFDERRTVVLGEKGL